MSPNILPLLKTGMPFAPFLVFEPNDDLKCFYWYHPPDYWQYMQFTEWVNQQIIDRFNEEGIDFAFPTQTIHLAGDKKRPLNVGTLEKEGQI